ncbi:PREDICTED: polycomb protein Asx isoform X2 [Papilio xuthus]|uniref:Polycomb protein Asx isoform X2 n=1 Tax=Papilio xuthus TaxID=66420 RepID=A0AAJ6ZXP2_PAPXU|nr:PREDICTED: polycomb protein Asx isoform X2 [Papilio xuthus]
MELDVSPLNQAESSMDYSDNSSESKYLTCNNNEQFSVIRIPQDGEKSSKHSSRKQSKRRKKSSNHSRPLPRIIVKPLPPPPPPENREWTAATSYTDTNTNSNRPSTMREVLASIPGFCIKPRKRSGKKLSTAAQLQQTREGCIDLETPDSILVNTNIRALLNKHTFSLLPPLYQYKLGQLLPSVDRPSTSGRLSSSSLNNEFFARACLEWQDCLSGGEFTPENQQKMKTEAEKEKSKIDPWKLKHFEPFWGEKSRKEKSSINLNSERPSLKTTIKLRPTASITSSSTVPKVKKSKSSSTSKKIRSVGAVTRSSAKVEDTVDEAVIVGSKSTVPVPDLLPLKHLKNNTQGYVDCQLDFTFSDSSSAPRIEDSTPVDPLLLPEESERNELKQELDISVVTIEESSISKDCEEDKANDSDTIYAEPTKRLSSDNGDYRFTKRIRYEDDYADTDNSNFLTRDAEQPSSNCSDNETTDVNEPICQNDDINIFPGHDNADTNSEDSKATTSAYEYDERSISSMSSLKIGSHVNNVSIVNESNHNECESTIEDVEQTSASQNVNKDKDTDANQDQMAIESYHEIDKEEFNTQRESPCNNLPINSIEEPQQNLESVKDMECQSAATNSDEQNKVNDEIKNEDKNRPDENITSYYDEHFKDAESFIMETGGLSILTPQNEENKYTPHPNIMELSSYMNETNVTAVVTMPMNQNPSIPMMEVTNSTMVSYPDDNMQDPAKPKNSAVSWKNENDWTNTENIISLHNFSCVNNENSKYASEDSKASIEDMNMNDESSMYKEERDANFNMESSNSSESCHSMKDLKQETDPANSIVSSSTVCNPTINSTTVTQSVRTTGKKSKSGKDSNRSRSSNKVPPGAVNLERSYQICQAVIQNSPNRDALRGQLRPPPALLSRQPRAPRPPPPPVMVRQLPPPVVQHTENVARCRSVGAEDACVCNLRAMILCKKCGAFCHDDCIGSAELCLTCLIR